MKPDTDFDSLWAMVNETILADARHSGRERGQACDVLHAEFDRRGDAEQELLARPRGIGDGDISAALDELERKDALLAALVAEHEASTAYDKVFDNPKAPRDAMVAAAVTLSEAHDHASRVMEDGT